MNPTATRRIGRAFAAAAAALVTAALTSTVAHATGTYSLLTLPDQGESAIYTFVNSAKASIDMTMYELRDTTMTTDLVNRVLHQHRQPGLHVLSDLP